MGDPARPLIPPNEPAPVRASRLVAFLPQDARPVAVRVPGRVNLMGDHTDYHDGLVLPAAIDRDTVAVASAREDPVIRITTTTPPSSESGTVTFALDDPPPEEGWARLAAEIAGGLADAGWPATGVNLAVDSTIPLGAGLSSSASFELAVALSLLVVAGRELPDGELARICRDAEERASGVPVGVMDQLVVLRGRAGHALLLDCRSLLSDTVPLPQGLTIAVVHSGVSRELADSAYAERRSAGEALAARLGLSALRDATLDQVAGDPFGRHVVTENARVLATADALRRGDRDAIAEMFAESHVSLRDDYSVSTPALDALVDALVRVGAVGARMTGGGFGGCVVAIVEIDDVDRVVREAVDDVTASKGVRPVPIPCAVADGAAPFALPVS